MTSKNRPRIQRLYQDNLDQLSALIEREPSYERTLQSRLPCPGMRALRANDGQIDAHASDDNTPRELHLISIADVMHRTALGRTSIYLMIKQGDFPAAVKIGSASRWVSDEIDGWIQHLMQARKDPNGTRA